MTGTNRLYQDSSRPEYESGNAMPPDNVFGVADRQQQGEPHRPGQIPHTPGQRLEWGWNPYNWILNFQGESKALNEQKNRLFDYNQARDERLWSRMMERLPPNVEPPAPPSGLSESALSPSFMDTTSRLGRTYRGMPLGIIGPEAEGQTPSDRKFPINRLLEPITPPRIRGR